MMSPEPLEPHGAHHCAMARATAPPCSPAHGSQPGAQAGRRPEWAGRRCRDRFKIAVRTYGDGTWLKTSGCRGPIRENSHLTGKPAGQLGTKSSECRPIRKIGPHPPDWSNPLDRSISPRTNPEGIVKKWRKMALFRGPKAPFFRAWSRGF